MTLPNPTTAGCTDMDPQFFADMRRELEGDEGRRASAYKDSLGFLTIGIGRLIDTRKGGKLSDDEIDYLLANDIRAKWAQLDARVPAWQTVKNDPVRMRALLNMAFQLGIDGLLGFHNSLALISNKEWAAAGRALRKSAWFQQTPNRAARVIRMIETGKA